MYVKDITTEWRNQMKIPWYFLPFWSGMCFAASDWCFSNGIADGFGAAQSSVTTANTEERREGIASFLHRAFGDVSIYMLCMMNHPVFAKIL